MYITHVASLKLYYGLYQSSQVAVSLRLKFSVVFVAKQEVVQP